MSVINKMLQDLESRKSESQSTSLPNEPHVGAVKPPNSLLRKITVLSILLLIGVVGYYVWQMQAQLNKYAQVAKNTPKNETVHQIKAEQKPSTAEQLSSLSETVAQITQSNDLNIDTSATDSAVKQLSAGNVAPAQAKALVKLAESLKDDDSGREASQNKAEKMGELVKTSSESLVSESKVVGSKPETSGSESSTVSITANNSAQNTVFLEEKKDDSQKDLRVGEKSTLEKATSAESQEEPFVEKTTFSVKTVTVTPKQLAEKAFIAGEGFKNRGLLEDAITNYQKALKHLPTHTNSRKQIAALLYARNESDSAIQVLEQGLALDSQNIELAIVAAKICMKKGLFQRGLAFISGVKLESGPDTAVIALRANMAQKAKRFELALTDYNNLLRTSPNNARWLLGKAISLDMLARVSEAQATYKQVLKVGGVSLASRQYVINRLQALRDKSNG